MARFVDQLGISNLSQWKHVTVGVFAGLIGAGAFWAVHSQGTELRVETTPSSLPVDVMPRVDGKTTGSSYDRSVKSSTFELPELPKELANYRPATIVFEITSRHEATQVVQTRKITRSPNRLHVRTLGSNHEWLFLRNSTDSRRVTGVEFAHDRRTLVEYDESELRSLGIARGWADVVLFGVDVELWHSGLRLGESRHSHGLEFYERLPGNGTRNGLQESWWNDEEALPLKIVNQRVELVLRSVEFRIEDVVLRDPHERYPAYARMDVADYREKHHEHGSEHEGHAH